MEIPRFEASLVNHDELLRRQRRHFDDSWTCQDAFRQHLSRVIRRRKKYISKSHRLLRNPDVALAVLWRRRDRLDVDVGGEGDVAIRGNSISSDRHRIALARQVAF